MNILRTVDDVRAALTPARREGHRIGLVPTMGALHEGHLSLLRRARSNCDMVVMSLFVNPTQFDEQRDLTAYPRDERRDVQLAGTEGVDIVFAPPVEELYPEGFATTVSVTELAGRLEGEHRGAAHFEGVTTIVTKLFNIVGPHVAYFGQKDVQQAAVIKRLVRDLDLPVRIEVCPTVREPDGLALSSRNALLSAHERDQAGSLHRALEAAKRAVASGEADPAIVTGAAQAELSAEGVEPEYFALVDADTFMPVLEIDGNVLAVVAARVGTTRLIDNQMLSTAHLNGGGKHLTRRID